MFQKSSGIVLAAVTFSLLAVLNYTSANYYVNRNFNAPTKYYKPRVALNGDGNNCPRNVSRR